MRIAKTFLSLALVADAVYGSSWFSNAAYNKWHETELERWLSDHDVPYPTPADRKELEKLVQSNWDNQVVAPYKEWDTAKLTDYLKQKGIETKDSAGATKDSLINQVQGVWYETEDKAHNSWLNVKDWILDSWTDSQLKAFCDRHGIPVPQPRKRDTLLEKARSSYETIAQKAGETAAYPGNWLYETWSESDLKEWLDTHGIPAPQPTTRDKLIAAVRRNSRLAYLRMQEQQASATSSAQAAYATLTDKLIDAWSESQLKDFCDRNGIPVPQGTKLNQLRALVRKHRADLLGDTLSASAASAYGAATSNIGSNYAKATDAASQAAADAFDKAINMWSETRLKAWLDARGIPVPQASKIDELRALVRKHAHKAASGYTAWTFDDWTYDNLKDYLLANGDAAGKKVANQAGATRDQLLAAVQDGYASASAAGGDSYASITSYLAKATDSAKAQTFETWSDSDLKAYLDSYGVPVPQGSTLNELRALARRQWTYFKYGTSTPTETVFAKIGESAKAGWDWVLGQLHIGADAAQKQAIKAGDKVKEGADAYQKGAKKAGDKVKQEL
ncbi:putative MSC1 protein [Neurospora tetraspora]|uniref:MSC1 protein n=1 Tax=Neurospora tetraspora TaxID=94610 RepID=A0AAE0J6L0_9PEZI|nr:putative MSC1 protein [Neurospora tetraspora]